MTLTGRITRIEKEARKQGISIASVCREAEIEESTFQRWKNKITSPTLDSWERFTEAFEAMKSKKPRKPPAK